MLITTGNYKYRCQHEDTLLHLGQTMSSNSQYFSTATHEISQKGDVATVDCHSVRLHGERDLFGDSTPKLEIR